VVRADQSSSAVIRKVAGVLDELQREFDETVSAMGP
jgi:hypothetical protein